MALSWGVGDVLTLTKLAWDLYHNCYLVAREAPDDFRQLVSELGSLQGVLRNLRDDVNSDKSFVERLGEHRKEMLERCLSGCFDTLRKLQELVVKYRKLGINDGLQFWKKLKWAVKQGEISDLKSKIMVHTCNISLCLSSIGNSSLSRIETSLMKALERQEATQEDADETIPLFRTQSSPPSALDHEDTGVQQLNRQFTGSTLTDLRLPISPERTPSMSEEDSEATIKVASTFSPRKSSMPTGRPHQTSTLNVEHDGKLFPPSPLRSEDGFLDNSRKSFSGKSTLVESEEMPPQTGILELEEVVEDAMQELFRARQKELTAKPLRVRPQDPVHRPSESVKQTFWELAKDEMDYRRPNTRELLRLGTWWLLKARFKMEFVERSQSSNKRGSISTGANSTVPSGQTYVDLLKSSWILYDIVLKEDNRNGLQSNENRTLFINLSDGINEEFRSFRSGDVPEQQALKDQNLDFSIWEHTQPEEDSLTYDAIHLGSDNGRWVTVDQDDAGDEGEHVLYRTFVDAAIGGKRRRVKTKGAPYILMLSTKEGESEPKVTICNQSGTLGLTRDFTIDDLQDYSLSIPTSPVKGRAVGPEALTLNFGLLEVAITFANDDELQAFMHRPTQYFQAVKRREPRTLQRAHESLIFKRFVKVIVRKRICYLTRISSVEMVEQLKPSTMKVMSRKHQWNSCDLRVLETTCKEGWRTTRRLILTLSVLPLSRVQLNREGLARQVTVKWSDCSHEKYDRTDGNYNTIYTHVYDDTNPNIALSLLFRDQADAADFERKVLHLSTEAIYTWSSSPDEGCVYDIYDTEPNPKRYKAILLTHTRLNWKYSELYYMYRDTDYEYDSSALRVRFPQIFYTDYISTHVEKLYKPTPGESPHFSYCDQRINHVPIDFENESISREFMSSLTSDYKLIFSRRTHYISTKAPPRFGSAKSKKGPPIIQLWRKANSTRLLSRWGDTVEEKWMSMAVEETAFNTPKDNNRASLSRVEYEKGRKIDMANLVARDPREKTEGRKAGPITIAFESVKG
ncbi:MAG: hypothetical protein Q9187_002895 [Circinaria calcarea]